MGTFTVRKEEHAIRDTEFARHLRRHLRDENLFTAFNNFTGRWFLGLWIRRDRALAQDIEDLGESMELANRKLVQDLERSRDGVTADDLKRSVMRAEKRAIQKDNEQAQEFQEAQDWVMKKTGSSVPVLMG